MGGERKKTADDPCPSCRNKDCQGDCQPEEDPDRPPKGASLLRWIAYLIN